jgi:hypothetical protein
MQKSKTTTNSKAKEYQKKLKESVENLHLLAKQNDWKFKYDSISDVLYYSSPKISVDSILLPLNSDNLTIRVNNKGIVEGIMIDNFRGIFIHENKEFADFARAIINKNSKSNDITEKVKAWGSSIIFVIRKMVQPSHC